MRRYFINGSNMNATQDHRAINVTTTLGPDVLLFYRMTAREELGQLFEFNLDLLSKDDAISLPDVLGQPMSVSGELPEGGSRFLHGFVNRFSHVGRHGQFVRYQATLVPWLWFLTRTADCRIFQEKTVPDIIKEVFRDNEFTDFSDLLTGTYRTWDYCVQYRETDFNFVSRLMQQEGIYYYFKHEQGRHELVLADDYSSHAPTPNYEEVPFFPLDVQARRERDHIFDWSVSQEVRTGTVVLRDFDFERPRTDLTANSVVSRQHAHANTEFFDYPGEYLQTADGDEYARKRLQEHQAQYERVRGTADARGLQAGALFILSGYTRDDQNREYLIVATTQQLENNQYESGNDGTSETTWQCSFEAMNSQEPFRSPRTARKPIIQGPQTAIVVGQQGEEIWTDQYGRVKVQFHWDRYGESNENSSCWVRVAQLWAGKTWGAIHIPRIGQEVIVEFLEGDPDRPIITGRVYNADEMPPYELPANQTQSGIKSRSSKQANNQNFNELRFEDKKGAEHIYFHAEKDFERVVENNDKLMVGFDKKDAGDQVIEIFNNQTLTIGNDQKFTLQKGNQTFLIEKGKRTSTIQGDDALTIKAGNQSIKISAGKNTTEAAQSILLKVGGSSIKIEPAGITIKSTMIKIQADAMVDMKAATTKCTGSGSLMLKGGTVMIN
jgi:type VI secretion system secreted protein VgrG